MPRFWKYFTVPHRPSSSLWRDWHGSSTSWGSGFLVGIKLIYSTTSIAANYISTPQELKHVHTGSLCMEAELESREILFLGTSLNVWPNKRGRDPDPAISNSDWS
jgi:hypothetical protein